MEAFLRNAFVTIAVRDLGKRTSSSDDSESTCRAHRRREVAWLGATSPFASKRARMNITARRARLPGYFQEAKGTGVGDPDRWDNTPTACLTQQRQRQPVE